MMKTNIVTRITPFVLLLALAACDVPSASEPELTSAPAQQDDVTFVVVEQMPALVGGLESLLANLKYPEEARAAGIEGRVFVQFVVDEYGRVEDAKVVKGIGSGCDEAALKAVQLAQFEPGRQKGQAVRVKMSIPITFKLDA